MTPPADVDELDRWIRDLKRAVRQLDREVMQVGPDATDLIVSAYRFAGFGYDRFGEFDEAVSKSAVAIHARQQIGDALVALYHVLERLAVEQRKASRYNQPEAKAEARARLRRARATGSYTV